ncbi:GNAT family N-acetyltransferase, partial [Deltaproteobacteria bacterium OttesenSCG-928-K17]|nr:GNAT family N-acetyltransferase [Deltaproteobacteria bacterium OttesenSCG-928-K17]
MKASFWARKLWFAQNLPGFKVNRLGSLSYISSSPVIEAANVVDGIPDSVDDVGRITDHYQLHHSPAQWWMPTDVTSPAAWWLADAGWSIDNVFIGMGFSPALSERPWPDDDEPPHLDIRPCDSPERVRDLGLIRGSVYMKENPKDGNQVFKVYQKAGEAIIRGEGGFRAWVCYVDGAAAASVSTLTRRDDELSGGETVGIYDLTTHPAHQNQGYGRA